MTDLFDQVVEDRDPIKKIAAKIPGFKGYIERQDRREADKMLRTLISGKFEAHWKQIGVLQQDLASAGEIFFLDDLEKAATKLQTFRDKIENASYGYSGFFDALMINEEELTKLYEFDLAFLDTEEEIGHAIGNVETSIGTDGLEAAIRNLVTLSRGLIDQYEKRDELLISFETNETEE